MIKCYKLLKNNGKMFIISHGKPKYRLYLFKNKLIPFNNIKIIQIGKKNKKDIINKNI